MLPRFTTQLHTYLCRVERLERVRLRRLLRRLHRAELAAPRARVPQQHDGARAPVPALADIGALGFFAHRVQVELFQRGLELLVLSEVPKKQGGGEGGGMVRMIRKEEGEGTANKLRVRDARKHAKNTALLLFFLLGDSLLQGRLILMFRLLSPGSWVYVCTVLSADGSTVRAFTCVCDKIVTAAGSSKRLPGMRYEPPRPARLPY